MCLGTQERGGPRRCSGDTRKALEHALTAVTVLEHTIPPAPAHPAPSTPPRTVSFANKDGRIDAMRAEIDAAIERLGTADDWQSYLNFASQFRQRSFGNQILIAIQHPGATHVAGFKQWQKLGRAPRRGEKAIWIQAPMTRKEIDPDTGEEKSKLFGFKAVPVFDISQTDGDPVPEPPTPNPTTLQGAAPDGMIDDLNTAITQRGFTVHTGDLPPGVRGQTTFPPGPARVTIATDSSDAQRAKTLAHELAHIELGHGQRAADYHSRPGGARPDMEVEAESTAFVISKAYGLDTSEYSFHYIDAWACGDRDRVKATATAVITASSTILGELGRTPTVK